MLSVTYKPFVPSVFVLNVIVLSVFTLNVIVLSVTYKPFVPSVFMPNVIMLSVVALTEELFPKKISSWAELENKALPNFYIRNVFGHFSQKLAPRHLVK
jgi:hypothetical protein